MSLLKEYGIKEDPRFKQGRKELRRIIAFVVFEAIYVFVFLKMGASENVDEYSYILGMPVWFVWLLFGVSFLFPLIAIIIASKIEECSLLSSDKKENSISGKTKL